MSQEHNLTNVVERIMLLGSIMAGEMAWQSNPKKPKAATAAWLRN
ncbi:hypothetical protein QD357_30765 [Rhizobium sp. BR 317]